MAFFTTAITTLKTLVCAIGAGLAAWGVINLLEGYGTDNPGAKSQSGDCTSVTGQCDRIYYQIIRKLKPYRTTV